MSGRRMAQKKADRKEVRVLEMVESRGLKSAFFSFRKKMKGEKI